MGELLSDGAEREGGDASVEFVSDLTRILYYESSRLKCPWCGAVG